MVKIISISGKKRHGKNLFADFLSAAMYEKRNPSYFKSALRNNAVGDLSNFLDNRNAFHNAFSFVEEHGLILPSSHNIHHQVAFATNVRKSMAIILNLPEDYLETDKFKNSILPKWGITGRQFYQKYATDAVRNNIHKEAWAISLFEQFNSKSKWIITDTRHLVEMNQIDKHDENALKILVFRPMQLKVSTDKFMKETFGVFDIDRDSGIWTLIGIDDTNKNVEVKLKQSDVFFFNEDIHSSETELDNYKDFKEIVLNDNKKSLYEQAVRIVEKYNL